MREGTPCTSMLAPIVSGAPPKRVTQKRWLIRTRCCRWSASSAEKLRPCTGCTPSSEKKLGETLHTPMCSAPAAVVTVTETGSKTARSAKLLLWLRHCSTFTYADLASRAPWLGISLHSIAS